MNVHCAHGHLWGHSRFVLYAPTENCHVSWQQDHNNLINTKLTCSWTQGQPYTISEDKTLLINATRYCANETCNTRVYELLV